MADTEGVSGNAASPRLSRTLSTASVSRASMYPIQSAQSSLSSFTSYFGASTISPEDEERHRQTHNETGNPVSVITKAFAPYVSVVASDDANDLVRKKGFASLFDLLRTFGRKVESKVAYKDPNGTATVLEDFNINFIELGPASDLVHYGQSDIRRPGRSDTNDLYLPGGDLVALERQIENEMHLAGENILDPTIQTDTVDGAGGSASYYDSFFASLLTGFPNSPHETFSHPVASCIAISSHNEAPIETLVSLYKGSSEQLPPYIDPAFLRYYILIHDEDEHDLDKSLALFARMKNSFGTHCNMLRLSSRPVTQDSASAIEVDQYERRSAPERLRSRWHGGRANSFIPNVQEDLSSAAIKLRYIPYVDHAGLAALVRDMTTLSIVPYMERCVSIWNEQIAGPRRGIAGRFFKAGRSLWGSSRTATPTPGNGNYDPSTGSYGPSTPEAQLRRLADFAFMLRDWKLANSIYDMLRKDYSNDKAWKLHAGAQEMYVVSLLLMPNPITTKLRIDTIDPTLDSALYGYLSRCSAPFLALRAMLLTAELLRIRPNGAKDDAARWIMRIMESNLVGEMTRALLVERTAFCFITGESSQKEFRKVSYTGSRRRKAAFWHVLAAEHWATIGKHRLARQSLKAALAVYGDSKWIAIQGTLNLLKTETGLVQGYQLTPAALASTHIPDQSDRLPDSNTEAPPDAVMGNPSATTSDTNAEKESLHTDEGERREKKDEEEEEDDTITIPASTADLTNRQSLTQEAIPEQSISKDSSDKQVTHVDDDEEVDDPLRI